MLPFIATINVIIDTYLESLERDLAKNGFAIITLIGALTWIGSPLIVLGLLILGKFQMPTDPYFYLFWFGLAFVTVIQFTFFIIGMTKTRFLAANAFANLAFVITIFYAVLFLGDSLNLWQIGAIVAGFAGAILFFDWEMVSKAAWANNEGLFLVLFSIFFSPLASIFYKEASFHAVSYHQFLTGRAVMDFAYYSIFFLLFFAFWYKKNPVPQLVAFSKSVPAIIFTFGAVLFHLVDSYLIFKLPISLLTVIGIISIPAGYAIGSIKYKEQIGIRYAAGAILIVCAVIFFVEAGKYLG